MESNADPPSARLFATFTPVPGPVGSTRKRTPLQCICCYYTWRHQALGGNDQLSVHICRKIPPIFSCLVVSTTMASGTRCWSTMTCISTIPEKTHGHAYSHPTGATMPLQCLGSCLHHTMRPMGWDNAMPHDWDLPFILKFLLQADPKERTPISRSQRLPLYFWWRADTSQSGLSMTSQ